MPRSCLPTTIKQQKEVEFGGCECMVGLLCYLSAMCIKISQMVQVYNENNKPVQRFCGFLCGLPH